MEPDDSESKPTRRVVLGGAFGTLAAAALTGTPDPAHAEARSAPWTLDVRMTSDARGPVPARPGPAVDQAAHPLVRGPVPRRRPARQHGSTRSPDANRSASTSSTAEVQDHRPEFGSGCGHLPAARRPPHPRTRRHHHRRRLAAEPVERRADRHRHHRGGHPHARRPHPRRASVAAPSRSTGGERAPLDLPPRGGHQPPRSVQSPARRLHRQPAPGHATTTDGTDRSSSPSPAASTDRQRGVPPRAATTCYVSVGHSFPVRHRRRGRLAAQPPPRGARTTRSAPPPRLVARASTARASCPFPDQRLQSFYWIQLYKVASASRAGAPGDGDVRPVAGAHAVARGLVEPQRAAGVLADPRLQPPGAGLGHHARCASTGTAHRQRAGRRTGPTRRRSAARTDTGCRPTGDPVVGIPGPDTRPPRSAT